jgi:hypothetical protein
VIMLHLVRAERRRARTQASSRRRALRRESSEQLPGTLRIVPPAGWYPDPAGSGGDRYWDGSAWTAHTRPYSTRLAEVSGSPSAGPHDRQPVWDTQRVAEGRIRRGLRLVGLSWRVVAAEPAMLGLVLLGLIGFVVLSGGMFFGLFGRLPKAHDFVFPNDLIVLPIIGFGSIASSYCNFAVTAMADRRLRGENPTLSDALHVANRRLGRLLAWTLVSAAVGLVLQVVADRLKLGGVIARWVLGVAWGLATTFVVPILVIEDATVRDSIRRSASVFKARWGETVVAQGGIGFVLLLALLPLGVVAVVVALSSPAAAIVLGVVVLGCLITLSGALGSVVNVALYHYAVDGTAIGGFTEVDLARQFKPR